MKLHLLAVVILVCGLSAGCANTALQPVTPVPPVVIQTEYVVKIPPQQLLTLPAKPANIDLTTATQKDVANWLLAKEAYTKQLENDIIGIAQFLTEQQTALNPPAK